MNSLMDEWRPFLFMRVVIAWKNWKGWKMKNLPPFDILDNHGQPTSLIPAWAYLYLDPYHIQNLPSHIYDWQKTNCKNIIGTARGQDQLVAGQCWSKVPFEDIFQNTVSCFFLAKSRSRKQFGTINKLYSRHFTSDNIREEGNKKWRSCIQNKRWDFEKHRE